MTDIRAEDCRIEGFVAGRNSRWYSATHLPTGIKVNWPNGYGTKREAMDALQKLVTEDERQRLTRGEQADG